MPCPAQSRACGSFTGRRSPAHCDNAGRARPGVTFPLRMSSLPVTCRSPPRAWHSGDEEGFMTRIPSHSIEDAPQAARSLLAEMVQFSPSGRLLNMHAQMAHSPAVLEAYVSIRRATGQHGTIGQQVRTALMLTAATADASQYALSIISLLALRAGW